MTEQMAWSPDVPYDALPALPPPAVELEPKAVLKSAVEARAGLATLAQAGRTLPDPNVLIHAVSLPEAQASSEIENIVTTAEDLFRFAQTDGGDHATREALRYRRALFTGVEAIRDRPVTSATATIVCAELHGHEVSVREVPGTRIANPVT